MNITRKTAAMVFVLIAWLQPAYAKAMKEIKKYDLPHERLDRIKQALDKKEAYMEDIG